MIRTKSASRAAAVFAIGATVAFAAAHWAAAQDNPQNSAQSPQSAAAAPPAALVGDADRAKRYKIAMCIGCHGIDDYRTAYPVVYPVPRIAGQNRGYIEAALKEYRAGERSHPTMRGIAGSLSDQDIADLAAFYSTVKPH